MTMLEILMQNDLLWRLLSCPLVLKTERNIEFKRERFFILSASIMFPDEKVGAIMCTKGGRIPQVILDIYELLQVLAII